MRIDDDFVVCCIGCIEWFPLSTSKLTLQLPDSSSLAPTDVLMRLSQLLLVIAATCLVTSEALAATTDSYQTKQSKGTAASDPTQRRLTLTNEKMQSMMKAGMNELDFAKELGVEKDLKRLTDGDGAGLVQFMMTDDYKKINAYQEFEARKEAQKAQKVQALKNLKRSTSKLSWSTVRNSFRSHH